jgi:hypothetical protein
MNRRHFLIATLAATFGLAGMAHAQTVTERVIASLEKAGYRDIEVTRTLLGRTRITGQRGRLTREIVLNARTGEVLRDIIFGTDGSDVSAGLLDDGDRDDDGIPDDEDDDPTGDGDTGDDDPTDSDDDDDGDSGDGGKDD